MSDDSTIHLRERLNEHSIAIEKVRERTHHISNSVATTSSALVMFNKNMESVLSTLKAHAEELKTIKNILDNRNTRYETIMKVIKITTIPAAFIFTYIVFTFEKAKISQFLDYIKGFL